MSRFEWGSPGSGPWARPPFRMLWGATATSGLGTAAGAGVISLVAILVLDVSASQVTVMIALGGLVADMLSLPAGPVVELRRKRPVMVGADLGPGQTPRSNPSTGR